MNDEQRSGAQNMARPCGLRSKFRHTALHPSLAKGITLGCGLRLVWRNFEQQRGSRLEREQPLAHTALQQRLMVAALLGGEQENALSAFGKVEPGKVQLGIKRFDMALAVADFDYQRAVFA